MPGQERVQEILWGLARRILKDLMTDYQRPGNAGADPENPGAFLRTLLLMFYGRLPEEGTRRLGPSPISLASSVIAAPLQEGCGQSALVRR